MNRARGVPGMRRVGRLRDLAMDDDGCAQLRPVPEEPSVLQEEIDATVTPRAADRLFRPPPGEVKGMAEVGEVLGEEDIVEAEKVLGADGAGVHGLVRHPAQN